MREEKHYARLARDEAMLLGGLLGKLNLKVENHTHFDVISPEARDHLAELQRQGIDLNVPAAALQGEGGRN